MAGGAPRRAGRCRNGSVPQRYDAVVIGGGHNGLVSAAYLARAGLSTLVLERRHVLGGAAVTEEIVPGFRFSRRQLRRQPAAPRDHPRARAAPARPRHPAARRHVHAAAEATRHTGGGDYLWRVNDHGAPSASCAAGRRATPRRTRSTASSWSRWPASSSPSWGSCPSTRPSSTRAALPLAGLARRFPQLPERQQAVFVQLMTMSAADFLDQWFETDPLKATMSASGSSARTRGSARPGTAYVLLHHYMGEIDGAFRAWGIPQGGTGGVSEAIASAARALGAEIRTEAPVARRDASGDRATGVVLEGGEEIEASVVLAPADAKVTFLDLLEPGHARRRLRGRGPPVPVPRLVGQGQPRGRPAARLHAACRASASTSAAPSASRPRRTTWSRPTTTRSTAAGAAAVHRHDRSRRWSTRRWRRPASTSSAASSSTRRTSWHPSGTWDEQREAFGDAVIDTDRASSRRTSATSSSAARSSRRSTSSARWA